MGPTAGLGHATATWLGTTAGLGCATATGLGTTAGLGADAGLGTAAGLGATRGSDRAPSGHAPGSPGTRHAVPADGVGRVTGR